MYKYFCSLALSVLIGGVYPRVAAGQEQPDFWDVATRSAASAADTAPEAAGLILGAALAHANKHDPDGVRPVLARVQLMLAYVEVDQFALYEKTFGAAPFKIDAAKFDPTLKGYVTAARTLAGLCDTRLKSDASAANGALRRKGHEYCARHFAEIEVALRSKVATDDAGELAIAIALKGLYFAHLGDRTKAIDDYRDAIKRLTQTRLERNAIESVDRLFALRDKLPNGGGVTSSGTPAVQETSIGADRGEAYVASVGLRAALEGADAAIVQDDAEKFLKLAEEFALQANRDHSFVRRTWPCNPNIAFDHMWNAMLHGTRIRFSKKHGKENRGGEEKDFSAGSDQWRRGISIIAFSKGLHSSELNNFVGEYARFLRENAHDGEAEALEQFIKSSASPKDATPPEWMGLVNCTKAAN